jgi:transcription initiation factor TFIIE subunit beta
LSGKGKKKILFYNERNPTDLIQVDQDIVEHWRRVQIEGLDETKLEDYLEKNKITSMKGTVEKEKDDTSKGKARKARVFKKHNQHLSGVLTEYDPEKKAQTRAKKH